MRVVVECYSGYKANERPLAFCLGARRHRVEEVIDRWYGPGATYFRVRSDDGNIYILRHEGGDEGEVWTLESFRRDEVR